MNEERVNWTSVFFNWWNNKKRYHKRSNIINSHIPGPVIRKLVTQQWRFEIRPVYGPLLNKFNLRIDICIYFNIYDGLVGDRRSSWDQIILSRSIYPIFYHIYFTGTKNSLSWTNWRTRLTRLRGQTFLCTIDTRGIYTVNRSTHITTSYLVLTLSVVTE